MAQTVSFTQRGRWASAVKADAALVRDLQIPGSGARTNRPKLVAKALEAIADDHEFDEGGVFRQRRKTTLVVEQLNISAADELYKALRLLEYRTVMSISYTIVPMNNTVSIEVEVEPPPVSQRQR